MKKPAKTSIEVRGTVVNLVTQNDSDYICLTDIARFKNPDATDDLIRNWLRNRNTIEFLGIWEQLHNPGFNPVEFDGIKMQAGLNSFALTPKQWNELTGAIGLISKAGRYGGTYAHKDIAFEFASWISVEFKLYLTNLESLNSVLIRQGLPQPERLASLNDIAITQMRTLLSVSSVKRLK